MILLVHSCEGREGILDLWKKCYNTSNWRAAVFFIHGSEAYSDQLLRTLEYMKSEYVWHMNDDYFIQSNLNWWYYWRLAQGKDALRMQPNVQYDSLPYKFKWEGALLRQTNESEYQISLNSGIWRRQFFIDCLTPGLDPWEQELSTKINDWDHKIYFVPRLPFWYVNGTVKGCLTKEGLKVIQKHDTRFKTVGEKIK
jgi:hypothetical protein